MITITQKRNMNRVYVTGDTDSIRTLLSDFRARHDDAGYWLPLYEEPKLRAAIAAESDYHASIAVARQAWDAAKSAIPGDYRTRHGATYGGDVSITGEVISEPGLDTRKLPWQHVATWESRVRDLTGRSSINGRVMDSETLYSAVTADGRPIYRISHSSGFDDDLRETYYLPVDLWTQMMAAEVRARGITAEAAATWLTQYRGCVGTELYEFAAQTLPSATVARPAISA